PMVSPSVVRPDTIVARSTDVLAVSSAPQLPPLLGSQVKVTSCATDGNASGRSLVVASAKLSPRTNVVKSIGPQSSSASFWTRTDVVSSPRNVASTGIAPAVGTGPAPLR